jgi:translation initiation factor 4E
MAEEQQQVDQNNRGEGEAAGEPDFSKKHPLEHRWTLWFDNPLTKQTTNKYGQTLRAVYTFDTVEDFWCLYNNIKSPSQLQPNATFYLFKDGIEPKWEDKRNEHGGSWTATVPRGPNSKTLLDAWWLNAVLGCIGEQFTDGDEINGIAVNIRMKGDRVDLWTKTASNEALQTTIGKQFKQLLDISGQVGFSVFADKLANNKAKDRYSA